MRAILLSLSAVGASNSIRASLWLTRRYSLSLFFHFHRPSFLPPSPLHSLPVLFSSNHGGFSSELSRSLIMSKTGATAAAKSTATSIVRGVGGDVGTSRTCWIKAHRESLLALHTPFIISLTAGNLKLDTFRHYISQDVHFLKAFVEAYKLAEDCADDDDDKIAISALRKSVAEELKMHDSFVQEWGCELAKESPPNPATTKYTDFLLATASGKIEGVKGPAKLATPFEKTRIAAYTLGAMTPCMKLYAFLAKEVQLLLDPDDSLHPYRKWIDAYSSDNFQASARRTEELLDKLSVSLTGEELEIIEKLYLQAMRLEIEFFTAQSVTQPTALPLSKELKHPDRRLMFFSDFDLTCTVIDSSAILAEIAIVTARKYDQNPPENQIAPVPLVDLKNTWEALSKQYMQEHEQCIESILSTNKAEEFNYEGLCKALELLSDFENKANSRVIESEVLKGVNLEDIKKAGEHIKLQQDCASFLQKIVQKEDLNVKIHVLSYCWCSDIMQSRFSSAGGLVDAVNIHANELVYKDSITTGEIVRNIQSPHDKAKIFSDILEVAGNEKKNLTVYVGDSVGDLLCLLKADIGIVVGSSASLRRVGTHFGVEFVPLFRGMVYKQRECSGMNAPNWKGLCGVLYTASSWAEINALILGS